MEIDIIELAAWGNDFHVTLMNYETEEEIAWYVLEIDDYLRYKIKEKNYVETLTIKEAKECDKYLINSYENDHFEDFLLQHFENEEQNGWFI